MGEDDTGTQPPSLAGGSPASPSPGGPQVPEKIRVLVVVVTSLVLGALLGGVLDLADATDAEAIWAGAVTFGSCFVVIEKLTRNSS
ncbi:MAG: hypothetical protein ACRCYU_00760 [Nocardioides sp.]